MSDDDQGDLFDPEAAKREAMERVERHAREVFKRYAMAGGRHLARKCLRELTSCDVRDLLHTHYPDVVTHTDKVLGPVMRALAAEGVIEKTDRVAPSRRVRNNNRPIAIWRSLVFEERES